MSKKTIQIQLSQIFLRGFDYFRTEEGKKCNYLKKQVILDSTDLFYMIQTVKPQGNMFQGINFNSTQE